MRRCRSSDKNKRFVMTVLSGLLACLILAGGGTVVVDPFFHYHGPIEGISYRFSNERYVNDGITRNFDYDAIITGTSMTENFKTSEFDELFSVSSVKVPFAGAMYKEVNDNLRKGLETHNVKAVLRCLDYTALLTDKDSVRPGTEYPHYLTNQDLFDDVQYLFNKEVLLKNTVSNVAGTIKGRESTNFDDYASWKTIKCSREAVLKDYKRPSVNKGEIPFPDAERRRLDGNLEQNVASLIKEYPETEFYIYFPPYSICYWDALYRTGGLERHKQAEIYTIEKLLQYGNVHLYCFNDRLDVIAELDNYINVNHYGADISSEILKWIKNGEGLLTPENYKQYMDRCYEAFRTYDYDSIFR